MEKNKTIAVLTCVFLSGLLFCPEVFANNLKISNVSLEDRDQTANTVVVEFDISWENSWKNNVNHDAAWVVVKAKVGSSTYWTHLPLYTATTTAGVNPLGYSRGTDNNVEVYVPYDSGDSGSKRGAFIRRSVAGTGSINSQNVRLIAHYGGAAQSITDSTSIRVQVVGVEMVFVPSGSFRAGDAGALTGTEYPFADGQQVSAVTQSTYPWYISTEGTITTTTTSTGPYYYTAPATSDTLAKGTGAAFTIPGHGAFPKGYNAFYAMKYEITEGLYVDFMNMLSGTQQGNHDRTSIVGKNSDSIVYRNTINGGTVPTTFTTSRPDRPMNYLAYYDVAAILDWLSLRPMSELEFEKLARGPATPVAQEHAWGNTTWSTAAVFDISPEDGTEIFTSGNLTAANNTFNTSGDSFLGTGNYKGPGRAGIFATDSSTRVTSGAGYYGAMELTGNLWEWTVYVGSSGLASFAFTAGDGELTSTGYATSQWGIAGPITTNAGAGVRGGSWYDSSVDATISGREKCCMGVKFLVPTYEHGGRGVRSCQDEAYCTN